MYKYMYYIAILKPGNTIKHCGYHPGNTPEEAMEIAKTATISLHNRYGKDKLTVNDLTVAECQLTGDHDKVLHEIQKYD